MANWKYILVVEIFAILLRLEQPSLIVTAPTVSPFTVVSQVHSPVTLRSPSSVTLRAVDPASGHNNRAR